MAARNGALLEEFLDGIADNLPIEGKQPDKKTIALIGCLLEGAKERLAIAKEEAIKYGGKPQLQAARISRQLDEAHDMLIGQFSFRATRRPPSACWTGARKRGTRSRMRGNRGTSPAANPCREIITKWPLDFACRPYLVRIRKTAAARVIIDCMETIWKIACAVAVVKVVVVAVAVVAPSLVLTPLWLVFSPERRYATEDQDETCLRSCHGLTRHR